MASYSDAWREFTIYRAPNKNLEEPTECGHCGVWFEADAAIRYSLDAFNDPDPDSFCPVCGSDDIKFHKPREDRWEE